MSRSQNDDLYELRQRYDIKETIGSGGFGKVKRAIHLPTGETVAIKVVYHTFDFSLHSKSLRCNICKQSSSDHG